MTLSGLSEQESDEKHLKNPFDSDLSFFN